MKALPSPRRMKIAVSTFLGTPSSPLAGEGWDEGEAPHEAPLASQGTAVPSRGPAA